MPDAHIPTALLFFSLGVETGHFLFIGFVLLIVAMISRFISKLKPTIQERLTFLQLAPTYLIGSVAMFWVIQRIAAF